MSIKHKEEKRHEVKIKKQEAKHTLEIRRLKIKIFVLKCTLLEMRRESDYVKVRKRKEREGGRYPRFAKGTGALAAG